MISKERDIYIYKRIDRSILFFTFQPQNLVMMGTFPECEVKLCDFEISRVILEGTEVREILGTPDYVGKHAVFLQTTSFPRSYRSCHLTNKKYYMCVCVCVRKKRDARAIPLVSSRFSITRINNRRCRYTGDDVSLALLFDPSLPRTRGQVNRRVSALCSRLLVNCHQSISLPPLIDDLWFERDREHNRY